MAKKAKVSASILAINYNDEQELLKGIQLAQESHASFLHLDVMDGKFVENTTFDFNFVKRVKEISHLPLDVHIMAFHPEKDIDNYIGAGAEMIAIHYEATERVGDLLTYIKSKGVKAGIAINPRTDVEKIRSLILYNKVDYVLVMGVKPGAYGQDFIYGTEDKIAEIKQLNSNILVSVDGGVNEYNAKMLRKCGADILVSAGAIFKSDNPKKVIKKLEGGLF